LQAHRSRHVVLPEPVVVGGIDDLGVGDGRMRADAGVDLAGRLERIEGDADRPVADRVDVGLESATLELGDDRIQQRSVREQLTTRRLVGARIPVGVEIRLQHRRGL
jgi:hypothetical protein